MRIAIACDHAGFLLKPLVISVVQNLGHEVLDLGTYNTDSVDYPDIAEKAGRELQSGLVDRAFLGCGWGVGACIAANKLKGVYAGVCHDTYSAHQGVEHDNMNALCLGARIIGQELAREIIIAFLGAKFSTEERHHRRFNKIVQLEQ